MKISIDTEGDFFTIYGLFYYLNNQLEKGKEYVRNDDFEGIIEWNGINLKLYRMCGRVFNENDRFKISLEGEYSYEDIYSITLLLNEILARSRGIKYITINK